MRTVLDQIVVTALLLACGVFALAVWVTRPAALPAPIAAAALPALAQTSSALVPRGAVMHPLVLPQRLGDVDLSAMPDRLANEAAPSSWRRVITVRGIPGVAAVEGPAVVAWTENGIAYWPPPPPGPTGGPIPSPDELRRCP